MTILRGEIYWVNLNPIQAPLAVTVVVGTKGENIQRDYPTSIRLTPTETGLPLETVFLGFQIRSLDPSRFSGKPVGKVSFEKMKEVESANRNCLGL